MNNIISHARSLSKLIVNTSTPQNHIDALNSIEYYKKDQEWLVTKIKQYIKKGYPLMTLVSNYPLIKALGKDSSSLSSCIIRYGDEIGNKLFQQKLESSSNTTEKLISKYGEIATREMQSKNGASIDNYIERHGEVEGAIRWQKYLDNRAASYVAKREAGHQYPKYNLQYYINLHGDIKGTTIYTKKINTQRHKVSLAYYIEQYGPILGPIKCKECKDHGSLNYFVKKYGEKIGQVKYKNNCDKLALKKTSSYYSKTSQHLFDELKITIPDLIYYGEHELIWVVTGDTKLQQRIICPDLFYKGKIIEFQGDVFHANPKKFVAESTPHPYNRKITAQEIWDNDALRIEYYISKGYQVLEVWELEWNTNKLGVIEKCLKFLTS